MVIGFATFSSRSGFYYVQITIPMHGSKRKYVIAQMMMARFDWQREREKNGVILP